MILELHSIQTLEAFEAFILEPLSVFLGAAFASWNVHNDQMYLERVSNSVELNSKIAPLLPALNRTLPTHPLFNVYVDFGTGKVQIVDTVEQLRDHVDEAGYRQLPFYREVASQLAIEDQLLMHVSIKGGYGILLTFHSHREFTSSEHLKASIIRGHILARYHTLEAQKDQFSVRADLKRAELRELLTPREFQTMGLLCLGLSNAEISAELNVAVKTVDKFVSSVYSKLKLECRSRLIAKYAPWLNQAI